MNSTNTETDHVPEPATEVATETPDTLARGPGMRIGRDSLPARLDRDTEEG